ncbi:hypothetical protein HOV93_39600 [Planctomycetes bacterium FF15]|uniref:Uncharacterized protein n=1 Tax=Bremerella alba TaxID=980252 RepID=A0A7V9A8Y2_9BACT|nr:hypothetical protein [Bremerella alba]
MVGRTINEVLCLDAAGTSAIVAFIHSRLFFFHLFITQPKLLIDNQREYQESIIFFHLSNC